VGDPLERFRGRAAYHAYDVVSLLEEELGEVGAVLPGDAGDEGAAWTRVDHVTILAGRSG
jgi:hypothetical protein